MQEEDLTQQDTMLDTLLGVIQRQKAIAATIGEELGTEDGTVVPSTANASRLTAFLLRLFFDRCDVFRQPRSAAGQA